MYEISFIVNSCNVSHHPVINQIALKVLFFSLTILVMRKLIVTIPDARYFFQA